MMINYFTGPGLARLYWLELLNETMAARKPHAEPSRPGRGRRLLAWILRGVGKRLSALGEKLAPPAAPSVAC
jgi:hypothetical protein